MFPQNDRQLTQSKPDTNEKRLALVIGNGAYRNAPRLANPVNDATDMAEVLRGLGFEVLFGKDQSADEMKKLITEFGTRLAANKGVGLFFYAGHGVQVSGKNFLIPVEADQLKERTIEYEAVDVGRVLAQMEDAGSRLNIVILDACRSNPFERSWRSDDRGLAEIKAPTGTLIAYATAPGKVASDGTGRNGLFTGELLKKITTPNVLIETLFKRVGESVSDLSKGTQEPYLSQSIRGDFYFVKSDAPVAVTPKPTPLPTPLPTPTPVAVSPNVDTEEMYWLEVKRGDTRSRYELYLVEYPRGRHVAEANARIERFKQDEVARLRSIERTKWDDAKRQDTREAYNSYLSAYPNGEFAADARSGIKALDTRQERARWRDAQNQNTKDDYNAYLSAYPNGEFAADARSGIRLLEIRDEEAKWEEVQILNRKTAYHSYLSEYPNGKFAASARQKIEEFEAAEAVAKKEQEKATEKAKWEEAERLQTIEAYDGYLESYPNGDYASLARLRLSSMGVTRSSVEETDWQETNSNGTRSYYERYLSKYPNGKYVSNARQRIKELDIEDARRLKEKQRAKELAQLAGKTTISTGERDLKTWSEAFDSGEEVVFTIKYYHNPFLGGSSDPSKNMKNGRLRVSKGSISFEPLEGGPGFWVTPDRALIILNEQPVRFRLRVVEKKEKKDEKRDYDFFHPSAFAFLTRQSVLGGVLNPIVTKFQCDGCDHSIAVLIAFLEAARESAQIDPVPPSGKLTSVLGTYVRKGKKGDYIQLEPDGTFFLRQDGKDYKGNYRAMDDSIVLQVLNAPAETAVIKGNAIIDKNGSVWEKQR